MSLNEDVKVKREALRLAQRLYEDNQNKVEQGEQAPIEVTRAQAQVASNQQALISAEGLVQQQELIVKTAITRGGLANPAIRTAHIIATDTVAVPETESVPTRRGPDRRSIARPARFGSGRHTGGKFPDQPEGLAQRSAAGAGRGWDGAEWRALRQHKCGWRGAYTRLSALSRRLRNRTWTDFQK